MTIAMLMTGSQVMADGLLRSHTAEYKIKISVLGGRLRTNFMVTDNGYTAASKIEATGLSRLIAHGEILERSEFSSFGDTVRPDRYESADSLSKGGQVVDFKFDWEEAAVGGTIDGQDFSTGLDGLVHDRVTLQYGLMTDLLNGVHRDEYQLQDAEELKLLSITNVGSKQVKVPFGRFEAVGIQHQAKNSSRITTLWCVEELGYLPVIIEQHRRGKLRLRAVLTEYTPI